MSFIPGSTLCGQFYWEIVRPILDAHYPGLPHTAALAGSGSDVLGFDDETSSDHDWGPRVTLFLGLEDHARYAEAIRVTLAATLPPEFRGYPTNFSPPDPDDGGTQVLQAIAGGPVNHRVKTLTVRGFLVDYLGFDVELPLEPADWLTFPEQKLRSLAATAVYHDEIGLQAVLARFAYYPHDVWLYLLAAGWARIGQEEHLMGRAGMVGDEVGSALIGARLVRDVMRLCFLMERTYAPYPKWFGSAFKRLACAERLRPILQAALAAEEWPTRGRYLAQAYEVIAAMHNALRLTKSLPEQAMPFFGRPFQVMALHGFAGALLRQIRDPAVKRIAGRPPIGGLDQFSDSTDLISNPYWRPMVRRLYK
jgi:hypothetical protein